MTVATRRKAFENVLRKYANDLKKDKIISNFNTYHLVCDFLALRDIKRNMMNYVREHITIDDAICAFGDPYCRIDIQCCVGCDFENMLKVKAAEYITKLIYDRMHQLAEISNG